MTTLEYKGNWDEIKVKLKQKFGILTERDMRLVDGKDNELLSRLEMILGTSKDELRKIISEL